MATNKKNNSAPLTFDLPLSLIAKITTQQKKLGLKSASEVVREAIASLNDESGASSSEPHRQISVRLPLDLKAKLTKTAKKKKMSIGGLLRVALETYEAKPAKKGAR